MEDDAIKSKTARSTPSAADAFADVFSWLVEAACSLCSAATSALFASTQRLPLRGHVAKTVEEQEAQLRSTWLQLEGGEEAVAKLYSIGEILGHGSFGKVFACTERASGEELCVKVVPLHGRRVSRVAKVCEDTKRKTICRCLQINHPNIVTYHRFLQTADALYTVMDKCHGPDLVDYVKDQGQQLPIDTIRELSAQILRAVDAVHQVGIMHRDVKPENFRFEDREATVLQLLDFGFAKPTQSEPAQHTITGTLLYAAPEVFDGSYCCKCDLWSAGIVLFQLFAGHPPFQTSDVGILRSLHRDPMLTGSNLFRGPQWRQAPRLAQALIRGLLTTSPSERLSAEEAIAHSWFRDEQVEEPSMLRKSSSSMLKRDNSNICMAGLAGDNQEVELKRSYFVWDLAGAAAASEEELPGV